ncbi:MAG TPA: response regulator transcription factor [Candidatus Binataceae bacterium]|nr:response regulator transcription factor [Candidatus Binataceae bacterium]
MIEDMHPPIRLIIADDHLLFRQGLISLLRLQDDLRLVGEVESVGELPRVVAETGCDILLLDLQMERSSMDEIANLSRLTKVIVLTANESTEMGKRALRLGAKGIVQKRFAIETLLNAIHTVADGFVWMPPALQAELAEQDSGSSQRLTAREAEIVRCVANGMRNSEVARQLEITESTVKTHLNNIFQKLDIRDRHGLMHYAIRTGLVSLDRDV